MNVLDDTGLLYTVAKYYYINNYSQNEIAALTNISRPQVSRILRKAKEVGIVKIEVSLPITFDSRNMAQKLQNDLNLKRVMIVPENNSGNEMSQDGSLYLFAAEYLSKKLKNCKNIGIGWGKTLYQITLLLKDQESTERRKRFYTLVGNSGLNNPYLQINVITDRFSEKFQGVAKFCDSAVVGTREQEFEILKQRHEERRKEWERLDAAVIGIGNTLISSQLYAEELYRVAREKNEDYENYIGSILGFQYKKDGTVWECPKKSSFFAISAEQLKQIPIGIGIAKGSEKVESIYHGALQGYFNVLVTDKNTASLLVEMVEREKEKQNG